MQEDQLVDMRGRTDPDGRIEPGWSPVSLGRCFGAVASSREIKGPSLEYPEPLAKETLAARIRAEDALLTEVAPGRAGSCAKVVVAGRTLLLEPLAASIGTVVHGIDLKVPLDRETRDFLQQLWLERKVIFFRKQHLSSEQHAAFSSNFGELGCGFGEPRVRGAPRQLEIGRISSDSAKAAGSADQWHSDASWATKPPLGSILLCKQPAPVGGDTLWCDAYAMYEGLSRELKLKLQGARCLHQGYPVHRMPGEGADPQCVHPALRTHPETGRTALYVSPLFTKRIVGVSEAESNALLLQCWLSSGRPEFTCRFKWEAGSVAMWDNRSTLHYACGDWWPHTRKMERICIVDFDDAKKAPFYKPSTAALRATALEADPKDTWEHVRPQASASKL